MPLPTQAQYEANELATARRDEERINREPLQDRKEYQANFLDSMANEPNTVAERVGWLINGSYGYGQMLLAKQIVASPRMNRVAALCQMTGVFEWRCPAAMGVAAWKKLTKTQQRTLNDAIEAVIAEAEKEM
jgi:macrodomain Ter protein organizer (MatP/YcbG family)